MRLYSEIAEWWPLISPPEEYADEIPRLRAALGTPGRLLELGSGSGMLRRISATSSEP